VKRSKAKTKTIAKAKIDPRFAGMRKIECKNEIRKIERESHMRKMERQSQMRKVERDSKLAKKSKIS